MADMLLLSPRTFGPLVVRLKSCNKVLELAVLNFVVLNQTLFVYNVQCVWRLLSIEYKYR